MEDNLLDTVLKEYVIPKVGTQPFRNFKDIRNRRKVAEAIGEVFIEEFDIDISDSELDQIMENIEHYEDLNEIRKDQEELNRIEDETNNNDNEIEDEENDNESDTDNEEDENVNNDKNNEVNQKEENEVNENKNNESQTKEVTNEQKS